MILKLWPAAGHLAAAFPCSLHPSKPQLLFWDVTQQLQRRLQEIPQKRWNRPNEQQTPGLVTIFLYFNSKMKGNILSRCASLSRNDILQCLVQRRNPLRPEAWHSSELQVITFHSIHLHKLFWNSIDFSRIASLGRLWFYMADIRQSPVVTFFIINYIQSLMHIMTIFQYLMIEQ